MADRGIGIIESIMAVVILGVLFMIILTIFPAAYKSSLQGERMLVATENAKQILEEAKGSDFMGLETRELEWVKQNNVEYQRRIEIEPYESYDLKLVKKVRALVLWDGGAGNFIQLETLLYNQY